MSIVITTNTNKELEINKLEGWLRHFPNWNGGQWSNLDVVKNPEKYVFFVFSESDVFELIVESTTIHGVDSDMGRDVHWEAPSLLILVESPILNVFVPIEKFFAENFPVAYMKKPNTTDN